MVYHFSYIWGHWLYTRGVRRIGGPLGAGALPCWVHGWASVLSLRGDHTEWSEGAHLRSRLHNQGCLGAPLRWGKSWWAHGLDA